MTGEKDGLGKLQYHLLFLPRGVERLEALGTQKTYVKGVDLNQAGELPDCCFVVKSGRVICYEYSYAGEQRVYNIMGPGSMFLEECLLFDMPCPVTEARYVRACV